MTVLTHILAAMLMGIPVMFLHECFHVITAVVCGVPVKRIGFSRTGMYTRRDPGPRWANITISAAGPLGNILTAAIAGHYFGWVLFVWVNLVAGIYNLLPIRNSDATRILALLRQPNKEQTCPQQ